MSGDDFRTHEGLREVGVLWTGVLDGTDLCDPLTLEEGRPVGIGYCLSIFTHLRVGEGCWV